MASTHTHTQSHTQSITCWHNYLISITTCQQAYQHYVNYVPKVFIITFHDSGRALGSGTGVAVPSRKQGEYNAAN